MANKELDDYLQTHSSSWNECLIKLRDQIGLTTQSFKIQKPYMLVIDNSISGYMALTFMQENSTFTEETSDTSQLSGLTSNIQTTFEQFNNQLPDDKRWRLLGHVDAPHNANIYCPPLDEITNKKYNAKSFEIDEECVTRSINSIFDNMSFLRLIFISLPSLLFWPLKFIYGFRRGSKPIPGKRDKQWIAYLTEGNPDLKPAPITAPDKLEDIVTSIFQMYDYHNISLSDDEKTTIQTSWNKKEFWPRTLDRKLHALEKQALVNDLGQIDYIKWITSINTTLKNNINKRESSGVTNYILCTLLFPIFSAKDLLTLAQAGLNSTYIMDFCRTRLPRSIEEAKFIANGIENSSDITLQRYLLSLILTTKHNFPELEGFQLGLLRKINPQILNLSAPNKNYTHRDPGIYLIADQLTNTSNPKILLGLLTYGSGYLAKLANEKLKEIEEGNYALNPVKQNTGAENN